jgi:DMSO/TMAO reductase YedYZ molybdopterin-dependent catalytic subunit
MISKRERGLYELYAEDSERADALAFGRRPMPDRRGFLKGAGLATLGALVGGTIPFSRSMPSGFIPAALAQATAPVVGKDGLVTIQDRPFNAETPAHLLDDEVTPTNRHFIRNNGVLPAKMDAADWKLVIDGEVNTPLTLTIDELKRRFTPVALKLQLECAGNGRAFFNPPAAGNQWTYGAVGCAEWTGVRLADVLKAAGVKPRRSTPAITAPTSTSRATRPRW